MFLILTLIFFSFSCNVNAEDKTFDQFMGELKIITDKSAGFYQFNPGKTGRSADKKKKLEEYLNSHNQLLKVASKSISFYLKNASSHFQKIINKQIKDNPPLSASEIYKYFLNNPVSFKTGDIIMVLPATSNAISFAYLSSSTYEHLDLIVIDKESNPFVMELSRHSDLRLIPLASYVTGTGAPLTRFAVYRATKHIAEKKFLEIIDLIKEKVIYDPLYKSDNYDLNQINNNESLFMYCSEFVYTVYKYILQQEFGWEQFQSWLDMSNKADKDINSYITNLYKKGLLSDKDGIIRPEFFSKNKLFFKVMSLGKEDNFL